MTTTPTPTLKISDLRVAFPAGRKAHTEVVHGLNLTINPGEVHAIVGESGSAKSATALATMGLLPAGAQVTGSVRLGGDELIGLRDKQLAKLRGSRMSMIFQDPSTALTPVMTIGDQIAEALQIHQNISRKAALARAVELLYLVGISEPTQRARSFPHELSGGMRQRVVIAIAIANDPELIVADEPTTALDVTVQAQILDVLRTAQEVTKAAVLLITHDLGVVAGLADHVSVMYAGRIVESAPVGALFAKPGMPYTRGLIASIPRVDVPKGSRLTPIPGSPPSFENPPTGCAFAPRCEYAQDVCDKARPALLDVAPNHAVACTFSGEIEGRDLGIPSVTPPVPTAGETLLRLHKVVKTYPITKGAVFKRTVGHLRAVNEVSLELKEGTTLGLVGESGCGKSTTLTQIMELRAPESGYISLLGKDVAAISNAERAELRRDIQIVFQDPMSSLDPRQSVFDIIAEPLRVHRVKGSEIRERVSELLDRVGLSPDLASRFPHQFSGGQRQRIGIARALALRPRVLILDEPVSALDVSIQAGILNLLSDLQRDLNLTQLFVSHDLSVIRHICDEVAVMRGGEIVEHGRADDIFTNPTHDYTKLLLASVPIPDPLAERSRLNEYRTLTHA